MKHIAVAFLAFICVFSICSGEGGAQEQKLTLEQAIKHASETNPSLREARARYFGVAENLAQARAGFLPTVTVDGDITNIDTQNKGNFIGSEEGGNLSQNASIGIFQPIFRGGSTLADTRGAKNTILQEEWVLRRAYQDVFFETAEAYWNVYLSVSTLDLQISNQEVLVQELRQTQARFEAGELTKTDVAQAQARVSEAKAETRAAQAALRTAQARFEQIVGLPVPQNIEAPDFTPDLPENLDTALAQARTKNAQLMAARFAHKVSVETKNGIKGELLPQVTLSAEAAHSRDPQPGFLDQSDTQTVRLAATVPLYTGGATRSRLRQSKYAVMENKANIADIENSVESDVIRVWENFQAAIDTLQARRAQIDAATLAKEGVKKEQEYGLRNVLDVLDANQELLNARVAYVRAENEAGVAAFDLARVTGILSPDSMGLKGLFPESEEIMHEIGGNFFGYDVDYTQ